MFLKCPIGLTTCTSSIIILNLFLWSIVKCFLGGCPTWDPDYISIDGNCYYFETDVLSYDGSIDNCKTIFGDAGRLFEPRDENTHDKVLAAAKGKIYWIGINDRLVEDNFQYASGGNLTFQKWAQGTPLQN